MLLMLSILIGAGCATAAYTQVEHQWANDAVWLVIGVFGFFSGIGLFVSIFCKDYFVTIFFTYVNPKIPQDSKNYA